MSKIICDICGTSYPETAKQCPICGCVRPGDVQRVTNEVKSDGKCFSFLNMLLIKLLYKAMPFESPILFLFSLQTNAGFIVLRCLEIVFFGI